MDSAGAKFQKEPLAREIRGMEKEIWHHRRKCHFSWSQRTAYDDFCEEGPVRIQLADIFIPERERGDAVRKEFRMAEMVNFITKNARSGVKEIRERNLDLKLRLFRHCFFLIG